MKRPTEPVAYDLTLPEVTDDEPTWTWRRADFIGEPLRPISSDWPIPLPAFAEATAKHRRLP